MEQECGANLRANPIQICRWHALGHQLLNLFGHGSLHGLLIGPFAQLRQHEQTARIEPWLIDHADVGHHLLLEHQPLVEPTVLAVA